MGRTTEWLGAISRKDVRVGAKVLATRTGRCIPIGRTDRFLRLPAERQAEIRRAVELWKQPMTGTIIDIGIGNSRRWEILVEEQNGTQSWCRSGFVKLQPGGAPWFDDMRMVWAPNQVVIGRFRGLASRHTNPVRVTNLLPFSTSKLRWSSSQLVYVRGSLVDEVLRMYEEAVNITDKGERDAAFVRVFTAARGAYHFHDLNRDFVKIELKR